MVYYADMDEISRLELETISKIATVYNTALADLVDRAAKIIGDADLAADYVYQIVPLDTVLADKLVTPWRNAAENEKG